ncbi:Uncharacterised protein [Serratia marcescens]|nr:Uncharacterised protein [Serratia marcescens]CVD77996.1 Uncharacterised protein [Serratia marcescens]
MLKRCNPSPVRMETILSISEPGVVLPNEPLNSATIINSNREHLASAVVMIDICSRWRSLKLSVFFSILPLTVCGENSAAHKSVANSTIK